MQFTTAVWSLSTRNLPRQVHVRSLSTARQQTKKTRRITENKVDAFIEQIGVAKTANIMGVSPGRVSQLRGEKRLRRWVIAAGKREKILVVIETAQKRDH